MPPSFSRSDYKRSIFINAPFDDDFQKLFDAILFCIIDCGFIARCALEVEDGSQVRLDKIFRIIEKCKFAVHDISRTQLDTKHKLPRFNMPLELGIFLGAKRFGTAAHRQKSCVILDTQRFRYQKFISDIAGQDPRAHANSPKAAVKAVRNWLIPQAPKNGKIPSAEIINGRLSQFRKELPALCVAKHWNAQALTFKEKVDLMTSWIEATPL